MSIDITGQPKLEQLLDSIGELHHRARTMTRNDADADDVVQETLEKALRAWPRLRPDSNVLAWLSTTMTNTFIDGWRREAFRRAVGDQIPEPSAGFGEPPSPWWLDLSHADVQRAAAQLRAPFRQVFDLYTFRGLSYEQISRQLGLPEGTIGTRLRRARLQLRKLLSQRNAANLAPASIAGRRARRAPVPAAQQQQSPLRGGERAA